VPYKKRPIGRRDSGGYYIIKKLYDLYLLNASLGHVHKAVYKYGIWALTNVYDFV
jgi:hypothetical protein